MPSYRQARLAEFLRDEISAIIQRELRDPRLGFVSVTRVELSPDLRHARVFVSVYGSHEEQEAALQALQGAAGFIRRLIALICTQDTFLNCISSLIGRSNTRSRSRACCIRFSENDKLTRQERVKTMTTREPNHSTGFEGRAAWQLLASARTVLIATHANPDADAVASILALRLALAEVVSNVICLTGDGLVPSSLTFLPAADLLIRDPATVHQTPDCIALLDCADPSRLGPLFHLHSNWFEGQIPIVNIDHHITNTHFGHVNLIDPNAASTTEILAQCFLTIGVTITPDIATCLLTGLYGDTLSFQTTSTSVRALELAALLLRLGARHEEIVNNLFRRKPVSTIRLWGAALSRIRVEPPLIWTEITRDMLHETGATPLEGEGIVNFQRS